MIKMGWVWLKRGIPGVLSSLLCGIWNCIVLGGDCPNGNSSSSSSPSSSLSLSHTPAPPAAVPLERDVASLSAFGLLGVCTLTPGVRGFLTGEENISACNSGASGMFGEDERVDSSSRVRAAVVGVADAPAAAAVRELWNPPYLALVIGVAWTR